MPPVLRGGGAKGGSSAQDSSMVADGEALPDGMEAKRFSLDLGVAENRASCYHVEVQCLLKLPSTTELWTSVAAVKRRCAFD